MYEFDTIEVILLNVIDSPDCGVNLHICINVYVNKLAPITNVGA